MSINYNKIWKKLIDSGLTKTAFRLKAGISTVSLAKLGKGEPVTTNTLRKISQALDCRIEDLLPLRTAHLHRFHQGKIQTDVLLVPPPSRASCSTPEDMFPDGIHYLSHAAVSATLKKAAPGVASPRTVNNYLVEWKKEGRIFPAGRGWYSDLKDECALDPSSIRELCNFLEQNFPLLEFQCWSTRQLFSFYQHLPGRHFTFLYADKEALIDLSTALQQQFPQATVRRAPTCTEDDFTPKNENFVLLPQRKILAGNTSAHQLPVEPLLFEFVRQAQRLHFADNREAAGVLRKLVGHCRINMAWLRSLAVRRNCPEFLEYLGNDYLHFS